SSQRQARERALRRAQDGAYYLKRAAQERSAAAAASGRAREAHEAMAEHYEELAKEPEALDGAPPATANMAPQPDPVIQIAIDAE
ncbi:MAG TPA: hypothetical protein VFG41_04520, partial [Sphingomicrobium sp.]|nr:hypothetical protein [Sphingomicrobium sp.]